MACTNSKWGEFWLWNSIWPWKSRSIIPQNNKDLNQGLLHLWSKFGDPSLNGWRVIARTKSWLTDTQTHTHTHTGAGDYNTRRPKLASGKNEKCTTAWNGVSGYISDTSTKVRLELVGFFVAEDFLLLRSVYHLKAFGILMGKVCYLYGVFFSGTTAIWKHFL